MSVLIALSCIKIINIKTYCSRNSNEAHGQCAMETVTTIDQLVLKIIVFRRDNFNWFNWFVFSQPI